MSSVSGQSNATCFKTPGQFSITPVRSEEDLKDTLILFYEYTKWLDLDLTFQNFDAEMANMPGKYAPPNGELFLARSPEGNAAGCVAVRPLTDAVCEMKRLWVRDGAKGTGLGKALVFAVVDAGRRLGYSKMRLDTLPRMAAAVKTYRSLGFIAIKPYYETPLAGTHFLEFDLTKPGGTCDHESQGTTSEE